MTTQGGSRPAACEHGRQRPEGGSQCQRGSVAGVLVMSIRCHVAPLDQSGPGVARHFFGGGLDRP